MWHTLSQTDYMRRMFGPVLPPPLHDQHADATPDEHRSVSEVNRLRRAHSAMIDARAACSTVSFVMGNETVSQIDEACASLRTVLFYHVDNIDRLRIMRGLNGRRKPNAVVSTLRSRVKNPQTDGSDLLNGVVDEEDPWPSLTFGAGVLTSSEIE